MRHEMMPSPGMAHPVPGPARALSALAIALASLIGLVAIALPVWRVVSEPASASPQPFEAPLVLAALITLAIFGAFGQDVNSGLVGILFAVLGSLVAVNASLRLLPTFLGASPIFLLLLVGGAVFGARFGFLLGTLSLLGSAFLTAGVGPWLPYQMIAAGWVGLGAGLVPSCRRVAGRRILCPWPLAIYGLVAGFLYGAVTNLWFWPYLDPTAGGPAGKSVDVFYRYVAFYLATSVPFDATRGIANAVLVLALGPAIFQALERLRRRLGFVWEGDLPIPQDDKT